MKGTDGEAVTTREVPRDARVLACPYLQTNVRWPIPIDQRLNELLERLGATGTDCTRSKLLAALVASAPESSSDLQQLLSDYASKTAGRVVLQPQGPIGAEVRRPGRRARS
jgi:hypothetical protein